MKDEIALEILRIHEESYGKGAKSAHAFVGNGYVIVVLDDVELLPNEKFLVENGKQDTVIQVRTQYQHAIRASFSAAIERATGRRVVGFASTTSMDEPRFAAEIFKLEADRFRRRSPGSLPGMESAATMAPTGVALEELLDWRPEYGVITVCLRDGSRRTAARVG